MAALSKTKKTRHTRPLSQNPAAVKLREIRKNRNSGERLTEKINSQRRSAVRRARAVLDTTAWTLLGTAERKTVWRAVEDRLRET